MVFTKPAVDQLIAHIIFTMNTHFQPYEVVRAPDSGDLPENPYPNHLWNGEFLKIVAAVFCQK